jgi:hypothetical protein
MIVFAWQLKGSQRRVLQKWGTFHWYPIFVYQLTLEVLARVGFPELRLGYLLVWRLQVV